MKEHKQQTTLARSFRSMLSQVTERAQTACCHASEVVLKSEAPEQSEDRGVVRGDGEGTSRDLTRPSRSLLLKNLDGGVQGSPAKPDLHGEITHSPCKLVYMVEAAPKITI